MEKLLALSHAGTDPVQPLGVRRMGHIWHKGLLILPLQARRVGDRARGMANHIIQDLWAPMDVAAGSRRGK